MWALHDPQPPCLCRLDTKQNQMQRLGVYQGECVRNQVPKILRKSEVVDGGFYLGFDLSYDVHEPEPAPATPPAFLDLTTCGDDA